MESVLPIISNRGHDVNYDSRLALATSRHLGRLWLLIKSAWPNSNEPSGRIQASGASLENPCPGQYKPRPLLPALARTCSLVVDGYDC